MAGNSSFDVYISLDEDLLREAERDLDQGLAETSNAAVDEIISQKYAQAIRDLDTLGFVSQGVEWLGEDIADTLGLESESVLVLTAAEGMVSGPEAVMKVTAEVGSVLSILEWKDEDLVNYPGLDKEFNTELRDIHRNGIKTAVQQYERMYAHRQAIREAFRDASIFGPACRWAELSQGEVTQSSL